MAVYPTIALLLLLSWTAQQTVSSPAEPSGGDPYSVTSPRRRLYCKEWECTCEEVGCKPSRGKAKATKSPRQRVDCKEKLCTCKEVGCMYEARVLPRDCPYGKMIWNDIKFVAKFDECKQMMEKEGKDTSQFGKIKCPFWQ